MITYDSKYNDNYMDMLLVVWDVDSLDFVPNPFMWKHFIDSAREIITVN